MDNEGKLSLDMDTKYSAPNVQLEFQCAVPTLATCPPSSRVTAPGHQAATSREGNHETSHNPELDHPGPHQCLKKFHPKVRNLGEGPY